MEKFFTMMKHLDFSPFAKGEFRKIPSRDVELPGGAVVKNLLASVGDARDLSSIPKSGRSPGVGNGNPLQYSCLENSMDRVAWWAIVYGVAKSWTCLNN